MSPFKKIKFFLFPLSRAVARPTELQFTMKFNVVRRKLQAELNFLLRYSNTCRMFFLIQQGNVVYGDETEEAIFYLPRIESISLFGASINSLWAYVKHLEIASQKLAKKLSEIIWGKQVFKQQQQ